MPITCTPCLGAEVKELLAGNFPDLKPKLESIADCPGPREVEVCKLHKIRGQEKAKREKRAPSAYNIYIKQCLSTKDLKGKPFGTAGKFMKQCAIQWKEEKKGA